MHCIDDKPNGLIVNYSPDWGGEARIAWYLAEERRDPGPTGDEPPVTRAVALAVETYLRGRLERVLDADLFVRRGRL
jgi:hypothetical protein